MLGFSSIRVTPRKEDMQRTFKELEESPTFLAKVYNKIPTQDTVKRFMEIAPLKRACRDVPVATILDGGGRLALTIKTDLGAISQELGRQDEYQKKSDAEMIKTKELLMGNLAISLMKKMEKLLISAKKYQKHKRELSNSSSPEHQAITTRLDQTIETVKATQLEEWGIEKQYCQRALDFVKKSSIQERNESAHETEGRLADFLLGLGSQELPFYREIFRFVYEKELEDAQVEFISKLLGKPELGF